MSTVKKPSQNLRAALTQSAAHSPLVETGLKLDLGLDALEPRILLDAAAVVTGAEMAMDVLSQADSHNALEAIFNPESAALTEQRDTGFSPEMLAQLDTIEAAFSSAAAVSPVSEFAGVKSQLQPAAEYAGVKEIEIAELPQQRDSGLNITQDQSEASEPEEVNLQSASGESTLIFVDASVPDYQSLIDSLDPDAEVIIIESDSDGVEQIANALEGRENIGAIHILSHGQSGLLELGTTTLSAESITGRHADELAIIGAALSGTADIMIYGCDFGTDRSALEALATATGADIAASTDDTGAAALGGDWDLEVSAGEIEAKALVLSEFGAILDGSPPVIDLDGQTVLPAPGQNGFTSLTFNSDPVVLNDGQVGETARYSNVGVINGQAIDLVGTVIRFIDDTNEFSNPGDPTGDNPEFTRSGTDAQVIFGNAGTRGAGTVEISWQVVQSGTDIPVVGSFTVVISDLDLGGSPFIGEEIAVYTDSLDSFALGAAIGEQSEIRVDDAQNVQIFDPTTDNPAEFSHDGIIRFRPLDNANASDQENAVQLNFTNTSDFTIIFHRDGRGGGFVLNADFATSAFDQSLVVDTNAEYANLFTEGDAPVSIAADTIAIFDDGGTISGAVITLTNVMADDLLAVTGSLPSGISLDPASTASNIILTGSATADEYEQAILAVTFENTALIPDETDRLIEITVLDNTGQVSNTALSTIAVLDVPAPEVPPILDLNSGASETDTDRNFSTEFISGSTAVSLVDGAADALDGTAVTGFTYLTITPSSALPDGASEMLTIAGQTFSLNADFSASNVTIAGTTTQVDISYRDGVLTVREVSNGIISNADMDALIRSVTYENTAANPDDGAPRIFDFQAAQYDPASFIIDFEELTPGTTATAEQIGSDPWWANASALNGQIQDANNAGQFNQTLADNADGTFLFHNTGGNVPNDQRIVYGADNIPVEENQDYTLTIDIGRQNGVSSGPFEVLINGVSIGLINVNSGPIQDWQTLTFSFNSGDATTVDLQLRNTSTNGTGNDFGIDNITFQRDPLILSNVATASVDVIAALPPIAENDSFEIHEDPDGAELGVITNGNLFADNGNGADSDVNGDPLSLTQINGADVVNNEQITLPSGALLTIRTDGTFDYDPNGAFDGLTTGETASEIFTYTLSDGTQADTDSATVTITVSGDNDAPMIDVNGPNVAGVDYAAIFVEDGPAQPLLSFDAELHDDEGNIAQVTITPALPVQNDGADEFLRIDFAGTPADPAAGIDAQAAIDLSIRLSDGQITAATPLTFGDTTFNVAYVNGEIIITNADPNQSTFDSDDLEGFLRLLAYENLNQNNTDGTRSFDIQVSDLEDVAMATSVLTVDRVNDAPIPVVAASSDGTAAEAASGVSPEPILTLTPQSTAVSDALTEAQVINRLAGGESAADLGLISAADLLAQLDITDAEQTEFGIGIVSADEIEGVWQYLRTDINGHVWTDFNLGGGSAIPAGDVLLIDADTILRFVPNAGFSGGTEIEFRVWDGTEGTASNLLPSSIVDDSGGAAPTNTSSLSSASFVISLAADTDSDGVINAVDVDDDNDGILDANEQAVTPSILANDSDNDGIASRLDIDSDNDGIPDNIEAQSTDDYIAPSGTGNPDLGGSFVDMNRDGLDDNYDIRSSANGGPGLTAGSGAATAVEALISPVNTDGFGEADYLDPDSDDDGINDSVENGLGVTYNAADTDGDGLADVYEAAIDGNVNDGFIVNEGISDPLSAGAGYLPDAGGDALDGAVVPLSADLDYRDVNDAPDARDDAEITAASSVLAGNVFFNNNNGQDSDPDGDSITVVVGGDASVIGSQITLASGALLTLNVDGTYLYDPNGAFDNLAPGQTSSDSFDYVISDPSGETDMAAVTITVVGVNDAPIASDDTLTGDEDTAATLDLFAANSAQADTDPDSDDFTITRVLTGNNPALLSSQADGTGVAVDVAGSAGGVFTVAADGTAQFDPNGAFEDLAVGETRVTEIVYQIDDGNGETDTAVVSYTVTGVNDPIVPVIPGSPIAPADPNNYIPAQSGVDGSPVPDFDLTPYFADVDGDTLSLAIAPADLPAGLSFDGSSITGTLAANASQGGTSGVYAIPVTVTDGNGDSFTTTVTYAVTNPIPDAMNDINSATEDAAAAIGNVITENDVDPDGDTLVVSEVDGDSSNVGQPISGDNGGVFTLNSDGSYSFEPNGDFEYLDNGEITLTAITYQISDGEGGFDNAILSVTVEGLNDAPSIIVDPNDPNNANPIPAQTGMDSAATAPLATAPFFVDVDGEPLTFSASNLPAGLMIDANTGLISGTPDGSASQGGDNNDGIYTVTVTATDPDGEFVSTEVSYTITNPPPVVSAPNMGESAVDGQMISIAAGITDPDGDVLSYSAAGLPSGLSINSQTGEITGTLDNSDSQINGGIFPIIITANDGEGGTVDHSFDLTVTNPAPEAVDDMNTASEDGAVTGNVITGLPVAGAANAGEDTDPDGDDVAVTRVGGDAANLGQPTAGTNGGEFTINPDGSYIFTANDDFQSLDSGESALTSITYQISDGEGGFDVATLEITVIGENDGPVAIVPGTMVSPADDQDYIPAQSGTDAAPLTPLDVSVYFTDVDIEPLVFSSANLPSWMRIDPTSGVITGQPPADGSQGGPNGDGIYSVTVTASDAEGESFSTQVEFTITNPAPVAADDNYVTAEDTPLSGSLTAHDSDPDGDVISLDAVSLSDGTEIELGTTAVLPEGELTVNSDGSFDFIPAPGFNGSLSLGYVVTDREGGTDAAAVTITVTPVNDPPVVINPDMPNDPPPGPSDVIAPAEGVDGQPFAPLSLTEYFADPEGDILTLTVDASLLPPGLSFNGTEITGTPTHAASQGGPNGDGVYTVVITATDPFGAQVTTELMLTITNPPPVAVDDSYVTAEDTPLSGSLSANDSDPDGDVISLDAVSLSDGTEIELGTTAVLPEGELSVNSDGSFDFTPAPEFNGSLSLGYVVTDREGGTDAAAVTITVTPVNDPPIVINPDMPNDPLSDPSAVIAPAEGVDGQPFAPLSLTEYFSDPDGEALILTVDASLLPPGLSFNGTEITGTPDNDASQGGPNGDGVYIVTVTATDPSGAQVTTQLMLTITNPPPIAVDDGPIEALENTPTVINVLGNDSDPDGDDIFITEVEGQPIAIGTSVSLPSGAIVSLGNGGELIYTPHPGQVDGSSVQDSFSYTVTDSGGAQDTAEAVITTLSVNDAPMVSEAPDAILPQRLNFDGEAIEPVDVSSGFTDPDGDPLSYSAQGLPPGLSVDAETGLITGTLPAGASAEGPYTVTITAVDPEGLSVTTRFVWSVENIAPSAEPLPPVQSVDGALVSIAAASAFVDPDGDRLSYSAQGLPSGLSIDLKTGEITGTLDASASLSGPYVITVTALDAQGASAESTFELAVDNLAPVIEGITLPSLVLGDTLEINIGDMTRDPDGDTGVTFSSADLPPGLSLDPVTGVIKGAPDAGTGSVKFSVDVSDGEGGVTSVELSFDVTAQAFIGDMNGFDYALETANETGSFAGFGSEGTGLELAPVLDLKDWFAEFGETRAQSEVSFLGGSAKVVAADYGEHAQLWAEAVSRPHVMTLQLMETISQVSDNRVLSWAVTPDGAAELPENVSYVPGSDIVTINRRAAQSDLALHIQALMSDGRVISFNITVDVNTGGIENNGMVSARFQTFDQQLQLAADDSAGADAALMKAIGG